MKDIQITVPVTEYAYGELTDAQRGLVDLARQYTFNSYSPYSHFSVGAAIRLDNGEVVCGANQENAAFPSGTCAERSACYSAGARFPGAKFESIAIARAAWTASRLWLRVLRAVRAGRRCWNMRCWRGMMWRCCWLAAM